MRARLGSERGIVTTELVAGVALLLLPVAMLVLSIPTWAETQSAARAVARDAARAYIHADEPRAGVEDAILAARSTAEARRIEMVGAPRIGGHREPRPGSAGEVEVTVVVRMPALILPWVGGVGSFRWTASHDEPIDVHRGRR